MFLTIRHPGATGLVGENAEDVREVTDASEEEKEYADSFRTFPAVIEEQLRHARAKVEDRAEVAKYLTPDVNMKGTNFGRCGWAGA